MAAVNDIQNQGMGMVGDMQGQMDQQQDKFKQKVYTHCEMYTYTDTVRRLRPYFRGTFSFNGADKSNLDCVDKCCF
jgi:hypothetical protein